MEKNGILTYLGCYEGDTCKQDPDHHLEMDFLQTLFSYAREFLESHELKEIKLSDHIIAFRTSFEGDIIAIAVCSLDEKMSTIYRILGMILEIYEKACDLSLKAGILPSTRELNLFEDLIIKYKLVPALPRRIFDEGTPTYVY